MKKKVSIHRFICTVHPDIRWEFQLGKFNLTRDFFFLFTISFHLFEKKFGMRFELCSAAADGNENRWKVIKLTKVRHQKGKLVTDTARECGAINVPAVTLYRVNWPIQCARVRVCIEVSKIFIHQLSIVDWLKFRHQWRDTIRWFEWTKKADAVCIFSALLTLIKCQSKAKPFVSDLLVFFCGINLKYATNVDSGRWWRETKIANGVQWKAKKERERSKKNNQKSQTVRQSRCDETLVKMAPHINSSYCTPFNQTYRSTPVKHRRIVYFTFFLQRFCSASL